MMRGSWKVYAVAAGVLILSFVAAWLLPTTELFRAILSIPGVSALVAMLFQFVRDLAAHERALDLQQRQHLFNLGAASHMAKVAFDKHVEFAEKYISTMQTGLDELFRSRRPEEGEKFLRKLVDIRLAHRAWITDDIEAKVTPFESALSQIGKIKIGGGVHPQRDYDVDELYQFFSRALGFDEEGQVDDAIASRRIISHLRDLLEVRQLIQLRREIVQAAIDALERKA
jgi:hypothetical protein